MNSIFTFIMASALLSIAPGPDNIFVLTHSAVYGKKSGMFITFGLCTGLIVHTTVVALGVATVIRTSTIGFTVLKYAGAAYLFFLAWQTFSASSQSLKNQALKRQSSTSLYLRGIIMNVTNPKVTLFFLAFLPQFAVMEKGPLAPQIFILGTVFIGVAMIIFLAIAMLASRLGNWLNNSAKAQVNLMRIAACVFTVLAFNLAVSAVR